jgi:S1-C subfamily serine protease
LGLAATLRSDDWTQVHEQAIKSAAAAVAPSVVQIETTGGADMIRSGAGPRATQLRKGSGPTTGLVIAEDGYIITSAFNFINKPTAIFVSVGGHKERYPAKVVASDTTRMLTLLKIETTGLRVPPTAPRKETKIGQTALALGRTWMSAEQPPSVSVGIISALDRIWGKAVQTDAKVSPVNYGGPLVDIHGRVIGVMVPASPYGQDETAGVEWYDSGIGFAIPLEDINAVLPRLREGKDLHRGVMGITWPPGQDPYSTPPTVGAVLPKSAADLAGIKAGDVIVEMDNTKISRQAQVQHILGTRYEGDVISLKVKRGAEEILLPQLKLAGDALAFAAPFLGILPVRDDPELGVEVRYVFPQSPAEKAGIKPGDRIMSLGPGKKPTAFSGRDELMNLMANLIPGAEATIEVRRGDLKELLTLTVNLGEIPDVVPDTLPEPAGREKALAPRKQARPSEARTRRRPAQDKPAEKKEPDKRPDTGLLKRENEAGDRFYWVYVPINYDPNVAHALIVWFHPPGTANERDKDPDTMLDLWQDYCEDHHLIMIGPRAENESGWLASEADSVREAISRVMSEYTIDKQRVVAHGMDNGGQMAYRLARTSGTLCRGVATVATALPIQDNPETSALRLLFYIAAGDRDPLAKLIAESKDKLISKKHPVVYRTLTNWGHQYLGPPMVGDLVRWIDSLDRL